MVARLALMTLHDELTNFIRRHDKIIKNFPIIAATDDIPEKNFVRSWDRIVERRRAAITVKLAAEGATAASTTFYPSLPDGTSKFSTGPFPFGRRATPPERK